MQHQSTNQHSTVANEFSPLFDKNKIPDEIHGAKLSEDDKINLANGYLSSVHIFNIDGKAKKGKVKLQKGQDGHPDFSFNFFRDELTIPNKILGVRLSEQQKQDLKNGQSISLVQNKKDYIIQVDNELNKVMVARPGQIKIPDSIGGYALTEQDKAHLNDNKQLSTRVFKGKDNYFLANVNLTEDKNGIVFSNIQFVQDHEVKKLMAQYNQPAQTESSLINDITQATKDSLHLDNSNNINSKVDAHENSIQTATPTREDEFYTAVYNQDIDKLEELSASGFSPSDQHIQWIATNPNLSDAHKVSAATALGIDENEMLSYQPLSSEELDFRNNMINAIQSHDKDQVLNLIGQNVIDDETIIRSAKYHYDHDSSKLEQAQEDFYFKYEQHPQPDWTNFYADRDNVKALHQKQEQSKYIAAAVLANSNPNKTSMIYGDDYKALSNFAKDNNLAFEPENKVNGKETIMKNPKKDNNYDPAQEKAKQKIEKGAQQAEKIVNNLTRDM